MISKENSLTNDQILSEERLRVDELVVFSLAVTTWGLRLQPGQNLTRPVASCGWKYCRPFCPLSAGRDEKKITRMDSDNTVKTETFLRRVFKTLEVGSEGKISSEELGRVLSALGRPQDEETRQSSHLSVQPSVIKTQREAINTSSRGFECFELCLYGTSSTPPMRAQCPDRSDQWEWRGPNPGRTCSTDTGARPAPACSGSSPPSPSLTSACCRTESSRPPSPPSTRSEWRPLIGPDSSRHCALIGWDHSVATPALLCHKEPAKGNKCP